MKSHRRIRLEFVFGAQVVLVTGVGGSSNQWQTQQQAYLARQAGIHVVAVGAGRWLDYYELGNVVSQPRTVNFIFASSFSSLERDATTAVRDIICNSLYRVVTYFLPPHKRALSIVLRLSVCPSVCPSVPLKQLRNGDRKQFRIAARSGAYCLIYR